MGLDLGHNVNGINFAYGVFSSISGSPHFPIPYRDRTNRKLPVGERPTGGIVTGFGCRPATERAARTSDGRRSKAASERNRVSGQRYPQALWGFGLRAAMILPRRC
jgi:hypothetical protein